MRTENRLKMREPLVLGTTQRGRISLMLGRNAATLGDAKERPRPFSIGADQQQLHNCEIVATATASTYLDEADPFAPGQVDGFKHDSADVNGLHAEGVEGRSSIRLVRVRLHAVEIDLGCVAVGEVYNETPIRRRISSASNRLKPWKTPYRSLGMIHTRTGLVLARSPLTAGCWHGPVVRCSCSIRCLVVFRPWL